MSGVDRQRLLELLDVHGSNPLDWPEDARDAARSLIRDDAAAARAWATATRLDASLDGLAWPQPDQDLAARIAARAPVRAASFGAVLALADDGGWRRILALALVPVAVGFLIGVMPIVEQGQVTAVSAETELAWISQFGLVPPSTAATGR
ncbi:MAG TPA: hypothetical protein VLA56_00060 [Pseudomonadales bacterium]|nr:hypothetical protein [Pseudomonadales bacterium]